MMNVKETKEIDVKVLEKIHKQCFEEAWPADSFAKLLSQDVFHCIVAEEENSIRGFLIYGLIKDEAEIITNCVLPEFRKQGIGKLMLQNLEDNVKQESVKKIYLEVAVNNFIAIALYQKMNFEKISQRKKYYLQKGGSFIDAFVMQKEIQFEKIFFYNRL